MIQDIIWTIFKPYEVKITLEYIDKFFSRKDTPPSLMVGHVMDKIKNEAIHSTKNAKDIVHSIRISHMHPEHISLIIIANILEWHIGSGYYHIYRGVLKDDGKELMRLLNIANSILIEKKYIPQEEINRLNNELKKQIASAG
jgi:hypothetical protein